MRILNEPTFKQALADNLALLGDLHPKYVSWVKDSVLKWLLKNNKQFVETFCSQVYPRKSTMIQGMVTWHYKDIDGKALRAYLENPFDQKDSEAGTLYVFLAKQNVGYWLFNNNAVMIDARDFFAELLADKPDTDLRKYTLDTLPRQMETWRRERDARVLREQQARLAELQRQAQSATVAENAILQALASSEMVIKHQQLALAWSSFTEGVDFINLGTTGEYTVINLLTPRALDWESAFKGNCMDGSSYKRRLYDKGTAYVSMRRSSNITDAVYTIELAINRNEFNIMQCEKWGYKHPGYALPRNAAEVEKATADLFNLLKTTSMEKIKPTHLIQNSGTEFTVNRAR